MSPPARAQQPRLFALVPCAGFGERAGSTLPKQYATIAGRPMVAWTLDALSRVARIERVRIVLARDDRWYADAGVGGAATLDVSRCGGATRAETVGNGLDELLAAGARDDDWVLVHDAARCLVEPAWVDRLIDACLDDPVGGLLAVPVADTLKVADHGRAASTLDREGKWAAQTPQMFRIGLLRRALRSAGSAVTDEASAVEALGERARLVMGDAGNLKVTWPDDFAHAEALFAARERAGAGGTMTPIALRFGEGWDIHALVTGRPLVLGGVTIPYSHGLAAHSDGDALLHAITDALLGGAALGDIGRHFPDSDDAFKGADSHRLLAEAARRVRQAGYEVVNVDSTIVAQAPRLAPHIDAMRARIASALGVDAGQVNVKAKTAEKMGPVGEGRAIEARAVCLLARSRDPGGRRGSGSAGPPASPP